ncbi:MAG: PQQ-dependent sugar dehydrogenase [Candidatus Polarisedimenticolia bacterium]
MLLVCLSVSSPAWSVDCTGISTAPDTALTTVRVASGFVLPVLVTSPPSDVDRLFVVEQDGTIRIVRQGVLLPEPFLDISDQVLSPADGGYWEEGLLSMAFDPNYATNGRFFVFHSDATGMFNVVERYERSAADPDLADPGSALLMIQFLHPADSHNGGMMTFGPDGNLYIATGDGQYACDPQDNAQNGASLLGKILRIDVRDFPYAIPPDNPFLADHDPGGLIRNELWQMGLRNPWRFSLAGPLTPSPGDLYIGDVGEAVWEEIDHLPAGMGGMNFGWDLFEGTHCPGPSCFPPTCSVPGHVLPVLEYDHAPSSSCAVTGGYVYGGCRMPGLRGTYFFADYCSAFIKSFRRVGSLTIDLRTRTQELAPGGGLLIQNITSFGEDGRGEIYIIDQGPGGTPGEVFKIVPVLSNLEVSGPGARPLILDAPDWTWEDLTLTSSHPITEYRVYRASNPTDPFACVRQGQAAAWPSGDPQTPPIGGIFFYLVTARNAAGAETSPGVGTMGFPPVLSSAPCPP